MASIGIAVSAFDRRLMMRERTATHDLRIRSWINTGHGMMGVSTGSARLSVDLMNDHAPAIDPAPYRPERFV
jgi:glycine/D-amino acid oxidase-like deaminating enzyme